MMFPGAVVVCAAAVCSSWNSLCSWACRYVLGLPAAFGLFLWRHRVQVRSDQLLRERWEGDSTLTNAHIQVRRLGRTWACMVLGCSASLLLMRVCTLASAAAPAMQEGLRGLPAPAHVLEGGPADEEAAVRSHRGHGQQEHRDAVSGVKVSL